MSRIELNPELERESFAKAHASPRKRHPVLLHAPGAYFNEVYNFIGRESYMQPHLHPGPEKIETIQVLSGRAAVIYFDDQGRITKSTLLESSATDRIEVPAFTWHTYVMLTEEVITYETMNGIYDPATWKTFAPWAPEENTSTAAGYLVMLRDLLR
jgi:cupin fold WbuC family metalloprotein